MPYDAAIRPWHDFFMVAGEASATLVGLLFVAMSVAGSLFSESRYTALRLFFSPSVVVFSCVLAAALIAIVPTPRWRLIALLLGGEAVFGLGYAGTIWRRMVRERFIVRLDLEDRLYYVFLPATCHAVLLAAAITLFARNPFGCDLLAIAMGLLMIIGLRNAWDMTVWSVTHPAPPPILDERKATSSAAPPSGTAPSVGPAAPPPAHPSSDPRPAGSAGTE